MEMISLHKAYVKDLEITSQSIVEVKSLMDKAVLITGATGLIGSYIVDLLLFLNSKYQYNIKIYALSRNLERLTKRFAWQARSNNLFFIEQDVNDEIKENIELDYVIHAASNAYPASITSDPVGTILSNVVGTNNLLKYLVGKKIKKFMFISTGEIYGQGNEKMFGEDFSGYINPLEIRSSYPNSKRVAETLCVSYAKQYGVNVVIARPCHTFGPYTTKNDNRASAQFVNNAIRGEDIILKSKGEQIRSYIYVADCVSALLTILIKGNSSYAYNISNKDIVVTIAEYAEAVAKITDKKIVYDIAASSDVKYETPITRAVLDSGKLESLNWKAKYSLGEGLKRTVEILDYGKSKKSKYCKENIRHYAESPKREK